HHANRGAAERNLAMVLKYVDREQPQLSPLLTTPKGNHGGRGRTLWGGGRGAEQAETLRQWVLTLAKEEAAKQARQTGRGRPSRRTPDAASPFAQRDDSSKPGEARSPIQTVSGTTSESGART